MVRREADGSPIRNFIALCPKFGNIKPISMIGKNAFATPTPKICSIDNLICGHKCYRQSRISLFELSQLKSVFYWFYLP